MVASYSRAPFSKKDTTIASVCDVRKGRTKLCSTREAHFHGFECGWRECTLRRAGGPGLGGQEASKPCPGQQNRHPRGVGSDHLRSSSPHPPVLYLSSTVRMMYFPTDPLASTPSGVGGFSWPAATGADPEKSECRTGLTKR